MRLVKDAQTREDQDIAFQKISDAGVLIAPAHGFGGWIQSCKNSEAFGWARITVAIPVDKLMSALDKIEVALGLQEKVALRRAETDTYKQRKSN